MNHFKVLILSFLLCIPYTLYAVSIWNVSPNGQSATLTPSSPYDNNSNTTTTLSIPNAQGLTITVSGNTENGYDFVYITDSSGNTQRFDGSINNTYTVTGSSITIRFTSDYSVTTSGVTVTISAFTPPTDNIRQFTSRYIYNLQGNVKVIGNTVLRSLDGYTKANNQVRLTYVDIDNDNNTFNSSSADINASEKGIDITNARVVWAGLYWQGYLHSNDNDTGIDTQYNISNTQATAHTQIQSLIANQSVLLKVGTGAYNTITPTQINWHRQYDEAGYVAYKYAVEANVTAFLQGQAPNATYTVANIPTRKGQTNTGNRDDGLGNFGAWTLVVVYDNSAIAAEKTRNISVFDGYQVLNGTTTRVNIPVSGFKTPKSAPNGVDSTLSIFAGEGDKFIPGDFLRLINQNGNTYTLSSSSGTNNFFNSSIEDVPTRNPSLSNNMGIDIHTQPIGTNVNSSMPIDVNQTSATIRIGTNGDHFVPSLAVFATELFKPEICYDYVIQKDSYTLNSHDRNISSFGSGNISVGVAIRSLEGDFDLENTSLQVRLAPTQNMTFSNASYSPNTVNILIPAIDVPNGTPYPNIAIGENATSTGGTIARKQRYFTQFNYNQTSNSYIGHFELDINTSIDFGSGPVVFLYSSDDDSIKQCPIFQGYHPTWLQFNIERTDSGNSSNNPEIRYPLYTQIVGRDFDISLVAYDAANGVVPYTEPINVSDLTVDVELIDAKPFGDQKFKCDNTFDNIIQQLPNGENSFFVKFPHDGASRVDLTQANDSKYGTDLMTTKALENAAFRMWLLVDGNNSIISHTCEKPTASSPNDQCFIDNVYPDINDTENRCPESTCRSYISPRGEQGCYACYRDYFATPICSRDNFAIRPETYRISLSDDNQSIGATTTKRADNNATTFTPLSAEYQYRIDAIATKFHSESPSLQYNVDANVSTLFNDSSTCDDQNGSSDTYVFHDGRIIANNRYDTRASYSYHNVGDHLLRIVDKLWTKVDPKGFLDADGNDYKTFPQVDDCLRDDGSISSDGNSLSGCDVISNLNSTHTDITLTFEPYSFDISGIQFGLIPNNNTNFLLMNDFANDYYQNNEINMSARLQGPIIAKGKAGTKLTNFTASCHAIDKNITLILDRTTSPLTEDNLESIRIDKDGNTIRTKDVFLQQRLTMQVEANQTVFGIDQNVTLSGLEFADNRKGEASVLLDTTIKKPPMTTHSVVNPIDVNYTSLRAQDLGSYSYADLSSFHIPKGTNTINTPVTYYFAALKPKQKIYGPTNQSWEITPIYVDIYCDYPSTATKTCADFNLATSGRETGKANWWAATMYQPGAAVSPNASALELQDFDLDIHTITLPDAIPSVLAGPVPSNTNIIFDDANAAQDDVNVSLAGTARPTTVQVVAKPAPFLRYSEELDPNGFMRYIVKFIGASVWSGVGGVGTAVDSTANSQQTQRLGW